MNLEMKAALSTLRDESRSASAKTRRDVCSGAHMSHALFARKHAVALRFSPGSFAWINLTLFAWEVAVEKIEFAQEAASQGWGRGCLFR